jgi:hypothetical protein
MKRSDPRYQRAHAWVQRLARQNRGIEAIAIIGDYHLSLIVDSMGKHHYHTWYARSENGTRT